MRIGVDLLGGETPPEEIAEGVFEAKRQYPYAHTFLLYGLKAPTLPTGVEFEKVQEAIEMDDNPLVAIRKKKDASMVRGIHDLKNGRIDAFLSTGNTGALIALSALFLTKISGIGRPSLIATLPTALGTTAIVDVGGSSLLSASHLLQCADLGVHYLQKKRNISLPRVGLLNIGTESMKGTPDHQRVYQELQAHQKGFVFVGNIEGKECFGGLVDLVVTDGFTGNVFLKTAEGASHFLIQELIKGLSAEEARKMAPLFDRFSKKFSQQAYPGAQVLGVEELVVKCHGHTTKETVCTALIDIIQ